MRGGRGSSITTAEFNHVELFGGNIWYVDGVGGSDTNDGTRPTTAFLTIGAAISACAAGDGIVIKAATYTENGLTLAKNGVQIWCEIGTILSPTVGTAFTVTGNYCSLSMLLGNGAVFINAVAGQTGMVVSGNNNYVYEVRMNCASAANLGFDVTGNGNNLDNCGCADPLVAAYKIQGDKVKLDDCRTGGMPADTSIGFWFTNSCDKARLRNCGSQGHASGGYVVDAGCTNGVAEDCSSGGGDGGRQDPDHAFVWSRYTYDNEVAKEITFAGAPTAYNIFKITGAVRVTDLIGEVDTAIANTASTLYLQLYSTGGTVNITAAPGTNIQAAAVKSILERNEDSTNAISLAKPVGAPKKLETTNWRNPKNPVDLIADDTNVTYLRLVLSAALASGKIHWHCFWEPLSDDGFVEAV